MTDLSPAARAVDRAIADRIQLLGEVAPSRQVAAAALRAAVAHTQEQYVQDVWQCDADELLAIAAELEAQ